MHSYARTSSKVEKPNGSDRSGIDTHIGIGRLDPGQARDVDHEHLINTYSLVLDMLKSHTYAEV